MNITAAHYNKTSLGCEFILKGSTKNFITAFCLHYTYFVYFVCKRTQHFYFEIEISHKVQLNYLFTNLKESGSTFL